jgi:hypothetical protein
MTMTLPTESHIDPLNSVLYTLLKHKFQEVVIANEGVSAHVQRLADPLRPGKFIERPLMWGEYYCVNCPFCRDSRYRLWVNHLYGSDYENGRRSHTHLATCYNENCMAQPGRRAQLEQLIFGPGRPLLKKVQIKAPSCEFVHTAVEPPGEVCSIAGMPDTHPAVQYMRSRGFDPMELDKHFSVGVCTRIENVRYRIMLNRVYIPIVFNHALVGWQGRASNDASTPKYYNCPGTSKSRMLYNFDNASREPYVVVVEGVPSVWRIGRAAVCLFGKTMSLFQQTTISTTWAGKPVVLILDNDAKAERDQAISLLRARRCDVRPVYLPDKRDPADYSSAEIQDMIAREVKR